MLMGRASLHNSPPLASVFSRQIQKSRSGGAQRSGAKSGAKRFDPSSDHNPQHGIKPLKKPLF
jgi:hypothetical protein